MSATATKTAPNIATQEKPSNALKNPTPPRKTYIEVMRIVAAFLVIVNHTNSDVFLEREPSFTWFFSLTYFFISKIAVPVFFMIMGGLLLQKVDSPKRSIQRVLRMVAVTVIFSIVYYIKSNWHNPQNMSVLEFVKKIFTSRTTNAFWYIYAYIGLLVLLPLLQRMARSFSKNAVKYLIVISMGVMGLIPLIDIFFKISPHFYITQMFFAPHIGVVFAGYYIEKYLKLNKKVFFGALATFVVLSAFQVVWTYLFYLKNSEDFLQLDKWSYLTITLSAACFYIIFKYLSTVVKTKETTAKVLCYFGSLTFGIYLLSDLIINLTEKTYATLQQEANIIIATVLWEIIVFVMCGVITAVLKLIPGVKKLI